jgi:hypothetical protein
MKARQPLHVKLAIAWWVCISSFLGLLLFDLVGFLFAVELVHEWSAFHWHLLAAPSLLVGAVICSIAAWLFKRHHRITRAHFACPTCDYDLRGLAPDAPCPECGRIPLPPPQATS